MVKERTKRLEEKMFAAAADRKAPSLSEQWRSNLMTDIRAGAVPIGVPSLAQNLTDFTRMSYRLAGVGATVALGMCILYFTRALPSAGALYADLFLRDPLGQMIFNQYF